MSSFKVAMPSQGVGAFIPASIMQNGSKAINKNSFQSNQTITFTVLAFLASILAFHYIFGGPAGFQPPAGNKAKKIRSLIPALGQIGFYGNSRPSWVKNHMGNISKPDQLQPLRMNIRSMVVTIVHGTQSAKSFFNNRDLNFNKGFQGLFIGIPSPKRSVKDVEGEEVNEKMISLDQPAPKSMNLFGQWTNKNLRNCLSDKRLIQHDVMRKVAKDFNEGFQDVWKKDGFDHPIPGSTGLIDMTEQLYWIIFRVSIRIVGSTELADDKSVLKPMMDAYWTIETQNHYFNTVFPNLPIPSNRRRKRAGEDLHKLLKTPIEKRIESGDREDDYTQILIDAGNKAMDITLWQTGMLFASIINSSAMFAWTLAFSSADKIIWQRLRKEIDETLERLCKENEVPSTANTFEKIASLSIEQLENNFNFTYLCIRESIRILSNDYLYRLMETRQPNSTGNVGGETIRDGEYLAFNTATINLSNDIYTNPLSYDPTRWERGEGSGPYEFVGWGTGLHPCIGMKLAKNELKIGLAFVIATMDIRPINVKTLQPYTPETLPKPQQFKGGYRAPTGPLKLHYTIRA